MSNFDPERKDPVTLYFVGLAAVVLFLALIVVASYYLKFSEYGASNDPASWADFAAYFGGMLNPAIGVFTIIILAGTLHINSRQLRQSRREVELSQHALHVTLDELQRGQALQKITEASLTKQIEVMTRQNDMSSAVSLIEHWKFFSEDAAVKSRDSVNPDMQKLYEHLCQEFKTRRSELAAILVKEHDRLVSEYGVAQDRD